jgi:hypothetical protein
LNDRKPESIPASRITANGRQETVAGAKLEACPARRRTATPDGNCHGLPVIHQGYVSWLRQEISAALYSLGMQRITREVSHRDEMRWAILASSFAAEWREKIEHGDGGQHHRTGSVLTGEVPYLHAGVACGISVIADAFGSGEIRLYADCHVVGWDASQKELEAIVEYLDAAWAADLQKICSEMPGLDGSWNEGSCAFIVAGDLEEFAAEESAGEFAA